MGLAPLARALRAYLPPKAKVLLIVLADDAGAHADGWIADANRERLAARCGLGYAEVGELLDFLERDGWITTTHAGVRVEEGR